MEDEVTIEYVGRPDAEPTDNPRVRVEMNLSVLESITAWFDVAWGEGMHVEMYAPDVEEMRAFIDVHRDRLKAIRR